MAVDIAIDLGTSRTRIFLPRRGITADVPSVVAVGEEHEELLHFGEAAYRMIGRTPPPIRTICPLGNGVIAHFDWAAAMLAALLVVMASVTIRLYGSDEQKGMTAFSLRNHTAIDFVRGGEHVLLADSTLMADESTVDYSIKGAWSKRHLSHHPQVFGLDEDYANQYVCKKSNLVSFDGKLLALWDGQQFDDSLSYRLPVDYLLVSGKQKPDVQAVVNGYDAKMLLIDGSVPRYLAEKWVSQAETLHLPYYNVGEGAMEIGF